MSLQIKSLKRNHEKKYIPGYFLGKFMLSKYKEKILKAQSEGKKLPIKESKIKMVDDLHLLFKLLEDSEAKPAKL